MEQPIKRLFMRRKKRIMGRNRNVYEEEKEDYGKKQESEITIFSQRIILMYVKETLDFLFGDDDVLLNQHGLHPQKGPISPYIIWNQGRSAVIPELLSFHTPEYINELIEVDKSGEKKMLCAGTILNPGSWAAALLAVRTTLAAMKYILDGNGKIAYALVRPPGHHAQPTKADGYCFLNNAGLAVQLALNSGCERVAVIDIDVHYGNGTAEGFYSSGSVLTISLHMNHGSCGPSHQQNGSIEEIGEGKGHGFNLNIPLPNGTGDKGYKYAMKELVVPAVETFEPSMVVLVVGQDSNAISSSRKKTLAKRTLPVLIQSLELIADSEVRAACIQVLFSAVYHLLPKINKF